MRSGPLELQPAREFVQRMHELEAELQRARQAQRRLKANPDTALRWGLETRAPAPQEDGWFLTYLDMMTLLLVAMIVMLAFSGSLARHDSLAEIATAPAIADAAITSGLPDPMPPALTADATEQITAAETPKEHTPASIAAHHAAEDAAVATTPETRPAGIPAPDVVLPYPAAPADAFEQSGYPSAAVAALASAYPTPMDLAPKPSPEPVIPAAAPAPEPMLEAVPLVVVPASADAPSDALPASSPPASNAVASDAPPVEAHLASPASAPPPQVAIAPPENEMPPTPAASPTPSEAGAPVISESSPPAADANGSQSEGESLAAALPLDELGSEVEVIINQRSVSLRINNEILFGTGQADLSPHGSAVLKRMAEVLSQDGYHIVVEGHTDSVPVRSNSRYPSNWELSTDRAGSVVRYLLANGIDKAHLKAVGYADTRPIADNQSADGRARNRRVELVIEKPDPEAPGTPG